MSKILVWDQDDWTEYFDISTDELWANACLKILGDLVRDNYIYMPEDPAEYARKEWSTYARSAKNGIPLLPQAEIDDLPENVKLPFQNLRDQYDLDIRHYKYKVKEHKAILSILENKDTSMVTVGRGKYERQEPRGWQYVVANAPVELVEAIAVGKEDL